MSNLQRILNMASKALDKKGQAVSNGGGKADWREMVRTAADKVTGDSRTPANVAPQASVNAPRVSRSERAVSAEDRAVIGRYEYLLNTAQPQQLEQVHREAFARLTPAQRDEVSTQLRAELPAGEYPTSSSPDDLARSATRGEAKNPGFLRKLFAKSGRRGGMAGVGMGAVAGAGLGAAGGLLAAVAGGAVLSSVAAPLLEQAAGLGVDFESLAGRFEGGLTDLTGGLDGVSGGLEGVASGAGEYTSGLGDQLSELGSNFEIPGLSGLGNFFGRE